MSLPAQAAEIPPTRPSRSVQSWFRTPLGRSLVDLEFARLAELLPGLYGPVAVQLGVLPKDFLTACDAVTCIQAPQLANGANGGVSLTALPEALPFDTKSVGLVILPHVLEFSADPHQVLRETARVLVPEGHAVIVGFNPFSLWGLRRVLGLGRGSAPWTGKFYRLTRVKDWLALLDFEVTRGEMLYYRPPLASARLRDKLKSLEAAGDRWWPMLAGAYVLVGRKRELGMTPLVPARFRRRNLVPGLAEPVVRSGLRPVLPNINKQ